MTTENTRAQVLATAETLVNGDRNVSYGDPSADFQRTADMWNVVVSSKLESYGVHCDSHTILEAHDVALMMALLKISRLCWSPEKADSWVDLAGYAACGADCVGELLAW